MQYTYFEGDSIFFLPHNVCDQDLWVVPRVTEHEFSPRLLSTENKRTEDHKYLNVTFICKKRE